MQLSSGRTLHHGRYRITSKLGQGGMGAVYLATDLNLVDRLVAIKENSLTGNHHREQFLREARLLSRLNHAHLPRVTDYFIEPDGTQYLVMDYIEGSDLEQLLRARRGPLDEGEVLGWMEGVLDALEYMHTWTDTTTGQPHPIIHRDIKPSNIKLAPNGDIYLVDFGLAKPANSGATMTGARGITPGYSPIEQYEGGTDARSDIYALGATLYVLLTGRKPPTASELAAGTLLPLPRTLNGQISRASERAILRAMQTQPAERFQHIRELRGALHTRGFWRGSLAQAAEETTTNLRSVLPQQSRSWGRWTAVPVVLGVLFVALFFYQRIGQQPAPALISQVDEQEGDQNGGATPTALSTATSASANLLALATATATVMPSSVNTATFTPASTATAEPPTRLAPTATAEASQEPNQPEATPTRRPAATQTPTAPPTATATPTSQATATSRPLSTATTTGAMTFLRLLSPSHNQAVRVGQQLVFQWESDIQLANGEAMEVVVWRPGPTITAMKDGRGLVDIRYVPALQNGTRWQLGVQAGRELSGGDYAWGVLLVQKEPYGRIRQLSHEERSFRIESSAPNTLDGAPPPDDNRPVPPTEVPYPPPG